MTPIVAQPWLLDYSAAIPFIEIWGPNGADLLKMKALYPNIHGVAIKCGMFKIDEVTRLMRVEMKDG